MIKEYEDQKFVISVCTLCVSFVYFSSEIKDSRVGLTSATINPALVHGTPDDVTVTTATISEKKYKKSCLDFLKSIGVNNIDDNNELDTVKNERDVRAYQTTMNISEG